MKIRIPIQTLRRPNPIEHESTRHHRRHKEIAAVNEALDHHKRPVSAAIKIVIRRVSPSDKPLAESRDLPVVLESFRRQLASWLGSQGIYPSIAWEYGQRPGKKGEWAVEICVEPA